jgi:hypothetical protein
MAPATPDRPTLQNNQLMTPSTSGGSYRSRDGRVRKTALPSSSPIPSKESAQRIQRIYASKRAISNSIAPITLVDQLRRLNAVQSPLLRLPGELLNIIYEDVMEYHARIGTGIGSKANGYKLQHPGIIQASHKLREHTRPMYPSRYFWKYAYLDYDINRHSFQPNDLHVALQKTAHLIGWPVILRIHASNIENATLTGLTAYVQLFTDGKFFADEQRVTPQKFSAFNGAPLGRGSRIHLKRMEEIGDITEKEVGDFGKFLQALATSILMAAGNGSITGDMLRSRVRDAVLTYDGTGRIRVDKIVACIKNHCATMIGKEKPTVTELLVTERAMKKN